MICTRLKEVRKKLKLSQEDMAKALKTTSMSISRYELGKMSPSADFIQKVVDTFDISANWLFTGQGDMFKFSLTLEEDQSLYKSKANISIEKELLACQRELIKLREQNSFLKEENQDLNIKIKEKLEKIIDLQDRLIKK